MTPFQSHVEILLRSVMVVGGEAFRADWVVRWKLMSGSDRLVRETPEVSLSPPAVGTQQDDSGL